MASKAQKRRQRQARNQTVASLYRQFEGQAAVKIEPQEDPRMVVLTGRARQIGTHPARAEVEAKVRRRAVEKDEDYKARVDKALSAAVEKSARACDVGAYAEPAGQAIMIGAADRDEAAQMWQTFRDCDAADDAYARRFVGIRRFPNVGKLEYLPERFETRDDDRPDSRSQEEKDRDAVNRWMHWQGLLGRIGRDHHTVSVDAMRQRARLVHAGKLTRTGTAFIAAMRALDAQARKS